MCVVMRDPVRISLFSFLLFLFKFLFVWGGFVRIRIKMNVECVQVNLHKSALATGLFSHELSRAPRIGFVSEPHTAFKKVVGKPYQYKVLPEIANDQIPRAALYIPHSIRSVGMPQLSGQDRQAALIYLHIGAILIVSAYLDINLSPTPDWLYEIINYVDDKGCGLILALDSNAHSTLYGPNENERGRQFELFVLESNLWIANRGTTPTFQTLRAESCVDVTLVRGVDILDWRVDTQYNASDHNSILFSIGQVELVPSKEIRPWKQAKWNILKSELMKGGYSVPRRVTKAKLDKMVEYLYQRLEEALDKACPKISVKTRFKGSNWFNDKLKRCNHKVRKQYNIARRVETQEEWNKYHRVHKKFKYRCKVAKRTTWRRFVTDTETEHKMSRLAKIAQHRERAQLHSLQKSDGLFTAPGEETILELSKAHFPDAVRDAPYEDPEDHRFLSKETILNEKVEFLSLTKIRASLEKFHPYKAPGPDGIKAVALRHLPDVVIKFLYVIYLACVKLHYTPILWQQSTVVFLPKPNKPNYVKGKYFRPIVLSNVFLKGLERLFTWRMDELQRYYPIHDKQHGFRKGRSTESAISNTVNYIEKCIFRKKMCIGVFLDISSAYDSIKIDHIREALYKHGGEVDLVEWYYHYLSHRVLGIPLHGEKVQLHAAVGFPQGGVASAKFWLLAFDPAIHIINSEFVEGNGYADDCCIVFGGRKPEVLIRRIQRVLDRLVTWGATCGLKFNPEKTVVVNFSRKRDQLIPHLKIGDDYVPYSKEAIYLGIKLDHKLFWRKHMLDKIAKSKKYLMKMANISKTIWGPRPNLSRWVFRCVVRPMTIYASVIWGHAVTDNMIVRFRRLNRLALSTYTMFPRSTPTRAVEILTDTFPLHIWIEKEALCAFIRLAKRLPLNWSGVNNNRTYNISHRKFWMDKIVEYDMTDLLLELDSCFALAPEAMFIVRTESFHQGREYFDGIILREWSIFSDGSKKDNKVGAAFVIFQDNTEIIRRKYRLPGTATVFQAELYAIFQAVISLREIRQITEDTCEIFSDSMSALQAINSYEITSSIVLRLVKQLNLLAREQCRVRLHWVKAHSGINGNELVDSLAKEGCELTQVTYLPLPKAEVRKQVLEILRSKWDLQWSEYSEARHSKLFLSGQDKVRGKIIYSMNRIDLRRLIMGITNHNHLKYHQAFQDDTINPTCRFCRMFDETFDHFFECQYFTDYRREFGISWPFSAENPWTPDMILKFINTTDIKAVLDGRELTAIQEERSSEMDVESDSGSEVGTGSISGIED